MNSAFSSFRRLFLLIWTGARVVAAMLPVPLLAASFSIEPVRVEVGESQRSSLLKVSNQSTEVQTLQLQPMLWSQANGEDRLTPTREIIATPQIFRIEPGATQIVRIGLPIRPKPSGELSYRLIAEQIASPPAPGSRGMQMLLRISIPVFVHTQPLAAAKLDVAASTGADGSIDIDIGNQGNAHAQVLNLTVSDPNSPQAPLAAHARSFYLLPGTRRKLRIQLPAASMPPPRLLSVRLHTQAGMSDFHAVAIRRD